jgi:hypothetical protein
MQNTYLQAHDYYNYFQAVLSFVYANTEINDVHQLVNQSFYSLHTYIINKNFQNTSTHMELKNEYELWYCHCTGTHVC